ncbi:MAG TPA: transposase [Sphaerochaeta sp.]|nr:transposase [Sphaerochaeta sp.]
MAGFFESCDDEVPLFYEAYPGSIVDISQLQYMLQKAKSYGYRHCGFILDRGYFCKPNIRYMDSCGYEFIIRSRLYTLLKDETERMDKRPNYMTVPAALKELDKIEMVRQYDGVYRLDHAVTKTQKTILKAFGLDSDDVHSTAVSISETLAAQSGGKKYGKN